MRGLTDAAVYGDVSPSSDAGVDVSPTREHAPTDVNKLSFPIQMVIAIVVSAVSASATIWAVQRGNDQSLAAMQSDIRNVLTSMEGQSKIDAANQRLADVQRSSMEAAMDDMRRQIQILQQQYGEISRQRR